MNKYEITLEIKFSPWLLLFVGGIITLILLCSSCSINRAQIDRDIDAFNALEQEVQKPISIPEAVK